MKEKELSACLKILIAVTDLHLILRFALTLILFGLLMVSCVKDPPSKNPIVEETTLMEWGYKTLGFEEVEQSNWSQGQFGEAKQYIQKIKAVAEVPDWPNAYYRFELTKLDFPTAAAAKKRLSEMHAHPPDVDPKMFPEYVLRDGIRIKNTVFFVSTDVQKFELEELPRVVDLLKRYVMGTD